MAKKLSMGFMKSSIDNEIKVNNVGKIKKAERMRTYN
jgi:hypothetical protein